MNTAIITFKTDTSTKQAAQKLADDLGLSLSGAINALVKQFVRSQKLIVAIDEENLELTDYAKKVLKESEEDRLAGRTSPTFDNADEAIGFLKK